MADPTEVDQKQISELVEDLRRFNAALRVENEMFEHHISRLEAQDRVPLVPLESLGAVSSPEMGGRGRRSKVQRASQERSQRLTLQQKCEIAQSMIEEMKNDLEKLSESRERMVNNYKATIEEAGIQLAEVRRASYEFARDVPKILQDKRGKMAGVEKAIRYIKDRVKSKGTQIEKLRLKNAALQTLIWKLQLQKRQKQKMEEGLQEADFQKLKIENTQNQESIDQLNQDLLQLKLLSGKTLQTLSSYKKKVESLTLESKSLSAGMASQEETLVKNQKETQQAEKDSAKAEATNRKLRAQLDNFRVPDVLDYIAVEASTNQQEQSVRAWERKVEIAEMELKTQTKAWKKLCAKAGAATANI